MNTKLSIKNFRVFDEKGVTLDLKPLTFLTGCNSAGKSSIVKAMLILKNFFMQIKNANDVKSPINLFNYKIDIATEELKSLGNFANTINKVSDSKEVTFEYTIYSLMLSKEVTVCLIFSVDDTDELKNGLLQKVLMKFEDQEFYSASRKEKGYTCNLNVIKDCCIDFLELEYLIHGYCSLDGEYNYDFIRTKTNEEYEKLLKEVKNTIKNYNKNRSKDILKYVYSSQTQNQDILRRYNLNQSILDWTRENGSYFRIPLILELDKVKKEDLLSLVNHKFLTEKDTEDVKFASEKIVNDFLSSDASSFFDYFKKSEDQYFESVKFRREVRNTGIPTIYDFTISQYYSSMNPEGFEIVATLGDELITNNEEKKNEEVNLWKNQPVDFPMLYEIVMKWNKRFLGKQEKENKYYTFDPEFEFVGGYIHYAYRALGAFLANIVNEVLNPEPWVGIAYASSSRVEASPYYSLSDNSSFSNTLKKYFDARRIYREKNLQKKYDFEVGAYVNYWIHELEIGDSISFDIIPNLDIVSPKLHKHPEDEGCFLTDVGFGVTQLLSVLITVETQILSRIIDASASKGVNRIVGLRNLFKMYDNWGHDELKMRNFLYDTIAIEEPEIHLHPKYQSKLAEMFVEAYKKWGVHFVIETHSEYLVRRLQIYVAESYKKGSEDNPIGVLYVTGKDPLFAYDMGFQKNGKFEHKFGDGFFNVADDAALELFDLENE